MQVVFAIVVAVLLFSGSKWGPVPDESGEYFGDARVLLDAAAQVSGKKFIDKSMKLGPLYVRVDGNRRDLAKMDAALAEIARQLPDGWRVVVRDTEIVLLPPGGPVEVK